MARNVVFVAPFPTDEVLRSAKAVGGLDDVRLLGIVHIPPPFGTFADYVRVTDPYSVRDVLYGVEVLRRRHGPPFRIVSVLEELLVQVAEAAERFGADGISIGNAELFREKARMKDTLRAAGLPVARSALLESTTDAERFAEEVGYPIVLKPPAGIGAKDTYRVATRAALLRVVRGAGVGPGQPLLAEEMIGGQEYSFETLTVDGTPIASSFSQFLPGCLEALENDWIQWACLLPREVDAPVFERARSLGLAANATIGIGCGMTHMEFFQGADGALVIGELVQRPPTPPLARMIGAAHDVDVHRAWARAVVDRQSDGPWERRYAAGCAFVRGMGRGRVIAVTGVRETHEALGSHLVEAKLPRIGELKNEGYTGDGYVVVRHESTDQVRKLIGAVVQTMRVHYTG